MDVLDERIRKQPTGSLGARPVREFAELRNDIDTIKARQAAKQAEQMITDLAAMKRRDPDEYQRLAAELRGNRARSAADERVTRGNRKDSLPNVYSFPSIETLYLSRRMTCGLESALLLNGSLSPNQIAGSTKPALSLAADAFRTSLSGPGNGNSLPAFCRVHRNGRRSSAFSDAPNRSRDWAAQAWDGPVPA
jgi:hypothetical protein